MSQSSRRPPIVGPVILIGIGVLALMHNLDRLPAAFWPTIWRLWPVILVLIGIEILLGHVRLPWAVSFALALIVIAATIGGVVYLAQNVSVETPISSGEMVSLEQDLQGAKSASVNLSFGAGTLRVGSLSTNQLMAGNFLQASGQPQAEVSYRVDAVGNRGQLHITVPEHQSFQFFTSGRGNEWDVKLNNAVPLSLRIEAGASTNDLDLTDLKISDLFIQAGMSTNTIRLPKSGVYTARFSGGLVTTTVIVPTELAARIQVSGGLSTVNVATSRFTKFDKTYVSPDYETAANKVNLVIESGLSTITIK